MSGHGLAWVGPRALERCGWLQKWWIMSDRETLIAKLRNDHPELAEAFDRWIAVVWPGLPKTGLWWGFACQAFLAGAWAERDRGAFLALLDRAQEAAINEFQARYL